MPNTKVMFDEVAHLLQVVLTIPVTMHCYSRKDLFCASTSKNQYVTTSPESRRNLLIHKERTDQLDMLEIARNVIPTNDR